MRIKLKDNGRNHKKRKEYIQAGVAAPKAREQLLYRINSV